MQKTRKTSGFFVFPEWIKKRSAKKECIRQGARQKKGRKSGKGGGMPGEAQIRWRE